MEEKKENNQNIEDKDRDPYDLTDDEIEFVCNLDVRKDFYLASIFPWFYWFFINWCGWRLVLIAFLGFCMEDTLILWIIGIIASIWVWKFDKSVVIMFLVGLWCFALSRFISLFWLRNRLLKTWKFDKQLIEYRESPEEAKEKYTSKQPNMFRVIFLWFFVWAIIVPIVINIIRA